MFGVNAVEVHGTIKAMERRGTYRDKTIYNYVEIETDDGIFRSGRFVAARNVRDLIEPGCSGIFVFVRWGGRHIGMVLPASGTGAVAPFVCGRNMMSSLLAGVLWGLFGLITIPIAGMGLVLIVIGIHMLLLPGRIAKRLRQIAEREGVDWSQLTCRENF